LLPRLRVGSASSRIVPWSASAPFVALMANYDAIATGDPE
jgi:hypothetical protein